MLTLQRVRQSRQKQSSSERETIWLYGSRVAAVVSVVAIGLYRSNNSLRPFLFSPRRPWSISRAERPRFRLAGGISFITGWANALCAVRYGVFGTMCTGNSINLAKSVAVGKGENAFFMASVIIMYMMGLVFYRTLDLWLAHHSSGAKIGPILFLILLGVELLELRGKNRWHVLPVAVAFGAQNALIIQMSNVVTNAVTGNITKVVNNVFNHLFEEKLSHKEQLATLMAAAIIVSFCSGVAACALVLETMLSEVDTIIGARIMCSFIPVAIAQTVLLRAHDECYAKELQERMSTRQNWAALERDAQSQPARAASWGGRLSSLGFRKHAKGSTVPLLSSVVAAARETAQQPVLEGSADPEKTFTTPYSAQI